MPSVIASLRISDRALLQEWVDAFGFELDAVHPPDGEAVDHAQLRFGDGWIMAGTPRGGGHETPVGTASLYCVVDSDEEVDAVHARAVAAGMTSTMEPADVDYGGRNATLRDRDGNWFSFGSYSPS